MDREWYNRGYYGTMSFNSRAVYQRYMGWYDANPVHLAPLDPADEAGRYVALMGGPEKVLAAAQAAFDKGALSRLLGWLTPPRAGFPIVTR